MTIGQLAKEGAVPASTIRYWERIGVLPKPMRMSGQRRYDYDAVHRIAVLRLARQCGFRLEEMRQLVQGFRPDIGPSRQWRELANKKQADLEEQIAQLRAMQQVVRRVLRCKCVDWNECGRLSGSALGGPGR